MNSEVKHKSNKTFHRASEKFEKYKKKFSQNIEYLPRKLSKKKRLDQR